MTDTKEAKEQTAEHRIDMQIVSLKQSKSRSKAWFYKVKNGLMDLCKSDDVSSDALKDSQNKLEEHMD